ncbi:hypothetical protein B0T25DRAFT_366721 [Lasiosphaeria hispida]|uniref:MOSC domain-containing protein n=1 Tax=Lasiosphaeria hispida TaxID=260671 RepID=A0AAJ0H5P4_9PEZI|nr:hypothetical protein B0T25DRAFT_366721 [Lasiosphaeria hispida]
MKITTLYVYPIKGLRGIEVEQALVGPQGIQHDRSFMLYERKPTGPLKKMQLSSYPQCALFSQHITRDGEQPPAAAIVVRHHKPPASPGDDDDQAETTIRVPLEPDISALDRIDVDLHGSPTRAYRLGDVYDAWFSARFGFPTVLVHIGDAKRAVLGKSLLPPAAQQEPQQQKGWASSLASYITGSKAQSPLAWITFTDVAPLLVTSETSLREVSTRLPEGQPVDMYKFRPNIVVDGEGEDEWAEDFWAELRVASQDQQTKMMLLLTGNCARCTSLNVDYETGKQAEGELGTVLKKLMKDRRVDPGVKWSPVFGRYAFPETGDGLVTVAVGDEVEVTRRNAERTVWDWPGL